MADSGWVAVAGAVVGGGLTGAVALLQVRLQHRQGDKEREHKEITERRAALMQIYTRYQLAADRLENRIRELAEARHPAILEAGTTDTRRMGEEEKYLEGFEAAQREYDEVCELLKLVAPLKTVDIALQQRPLFNRFAREALDGSYNHDASYELIAHAARSVLTAMRVDLQSPE